MIKCCILFSLFAGSCAWAADPADLLQQAHVAAAKRKYKDAEKLAGQANAIWTQDAGGRSADYADSLLLQAIALLGQDQGKFHSVREFKRPLSSKDAEILVLWETQSANLLDKALKIADAKPDVRAVALELAALQPRNAEKVGKFQQEATDLHASAVAEIMHTSSGADTDRKKEGEIDPPTLLSKVEPNYSEVAQVLYKTGTVLLEVVIGTDGRVTWCKAKVAQGWGFDEQAAKAVQQWRFKPATRNGQPVPVSVGVEVSFKLR